MGVVARILTKKKYMDIYKLIHDVKLAAVGAGLKPIIDTKLYNNTMEGGVYTTANIADTYEDIPEAQEFLMYISSYDPYIGVFDWIDKNLMCVIFIENISGREKILLDFLYEYFKLNPEDYFWDDEECFYTYEDIIKIKQQEFDPDWCCKNLYPEVKKNDE